MSKIPPCKQLEVGRFLMACQFDVLLNAGLPTDGGDAAIAALDRIEWLEQTLSVYRPESELSRLNRSAFNAPQEVSDDLWQLLEIAVDVYRATGGAFDITAASLSEAWGFARRQGFMPTDEQIAAALGKVGTEHVVLDETRKAVQFLRDGLKINSGGIGKGYAIDQGAAILEQRAVHDYLLHGGQSSLRAAGNRHDLDRQRGWRIGVKHPEQPRILLGEFILSDVSLGTSGPAQQFFYYNGVRYGHIIDPRKGWPASGMLSISVLHPSAAYADALATGLYVMGIDAAIAYCESHSDTGMLAILPTKRSGDVEIVSCNLGNQEWIPAR